MDTLRIGTTPMINTTSSMTKKPSLHEINPGLLTYRPDLDGLRALAIILVMLDHLFGSFGWFRGGLGVDMFFVLSGYLITSILSRSLEGGSFSLANFYARRVRRLFPTLIVTFGVSLWVGWMLLEPHALRLLGATVAASGTSSINLILASGAPVFHIDPKELPFGQLWSLALEEQFYLIFPFVFVGLSRCAPKLRIPFFMVLAGLSWTYWYTFKHLWGQTYYNPLARSWELCVGVILALCWVHRGTWFGKIGEGQKKALENKARTGKCLRRIFWTMVVALEVLGVMLFEKVSHFSMTVCFGLGLMALIHSLILKEWTLPQFLTGVGITIMASDMEGNGWMVALGASLVLLAQYEPWWRTGQNGKGYGDGALGQGMVQSREKEEVHGMVQSREKEEVHGMVQSREKEEVHGVVQSREKEEVHGVVQSREQEEAQGVDLGGYSSAQEALSWKGRDSKILPDSRDLPDTKTLPNVFGKGRIGLLGWYLLISALVISNLIPLCFSAILATLGTACIIAGGEGFWISRHVLASSPMVYIGRISYALYVVHYPLYVMWGLAQGEVVVDHGTLWFIFLLSFPLAAALYHWVEQPTRHRTALGPWIGALALCVGLGYLAYIYV